MPRAYFRFYAELNDFLPRERRQSEFPHEFRGRASVKDMIESLGVPHTEVDLILVNGRSVDFGHPVRDGDRISVYPVFEALDISPALRLRPRPLREAKFVLDGHLGRLAAYLRLLGFDTLYANDWPDETLARISADQRRILLTRDRGLLKRSIVERGYCVRDDVPRRQLQEVIGRFDLFGSVAPFRRCLSCNGLLRPAEKAAVADRLPARTLQYYDDFRQCADCGKVFWAGSHYRRMQAFLSRLLPGAGPAE
jgi:uncharacterized protein with PIN domain/sulfur carrier protein ThiS